MTTAWGYQQLKEETYLSVNTVNYKRVQQKREQVAIVCGCLLRTWYLLEGSELWNALKLQPGRLFQQTCLEWLRIVGV